MNTKETYAPEPLLLKPRAAARKLGVGVIALRTLLSRGELRVVTVGARTMVVAKSLAEWIEKQQPPTP